MCNLAFYSSLAGGPISSIVSTGRIKVHTGVIDKKSELKFDH